MGGRRSKKTSQRIIINRVIAVVILVFVLALLSGLIWYLNNISPVNKKDETQIEISIPQDSTASEIADILLQNGVIKSKTAFKIYTRLHGSSDLTAGSYYLSKSMSLKEIIKTIKSNDTIQISITFIEGKNIKWIAKEIANITNNTEEDVFNLLKNEEYIDSLIEKYWFLTKDIKNKDIYYPLEGYLFPDTYLIDNRDITVEEIFEMMLDRMEDILDEYKEQIQEKGYNINKILTVASIIELESIGEDGRKDVASVIYNRLNKGMAIQSDVTTYYAFQVDIGERDLFLKEINTYNPYNTRGPDMEGKLPVGPMCLVGKSCIDAALNPSSTDYLFFVADKNGKLYFSKTNGEHEEIISELQQEGLWLEY